MRSPEIVLSVIEVQMGFIRSQRANIWPSRDGTMNRHNLIADVRFNSEEGAANARLIAACPAMSDYVRMRADKGDADAKAIISQYLR